MIEAVFDSCIGCNICVKVCPDDVFDAVADGNPVIARQDDCQTCFLCEAYCPVDALWVSPLGEPDANFDLQTVLASGKVGSYSSRIGWKKGRPAPRDPNAFVKTVDTFEGDPNDKVRIHLMDVRNRSFVDPASESP